MTREETEAAQRRAKQLVRWKVWIQRLWVITAVGVALLVLGVAVLVFLAVISVPPPGSQPTTQPDTKTYTDLGPFAPLALGAMGLGVLLSVVGLVAVGIAAMGYDACVRTTLRLGKEKEAVVDWLASSLAEKDCGDYGTRISILGDFGSTRATTSIIPALEDQNEGIRKKAVDALGKIGDVRAAEPLAKALTDHSLRKEVAHVLDQLGWKPGNDAEAVHYLLAKGEWDRLVTMGEPAVEPLIESLRHQDTSVRKGAAQTLGELGSERAIEPLTRASSDKDEGVRRAAQAALRRIRSR